MTARTKQQQQIDAANDNIMVIVGRLLEATQAASDGIKALCEETKQNAATAQAAQQAIASLTLVVAELDRIVRSGQGLPLMMQVRLNTEAMERMRNDHDDLAETVDTDHDGLKSRVAELEKYKAIDSGGHNVVWRVAQAVAWVITAAIAIYAAYKSK